ncbi:MAG: TIGR03986 family CRISPR-associated RAMP protein [Gracilibacteraceae bacterium]|nr:TIGR03986 family CRISPR-associated RAMP protein [Gracilibacteraceae bacterium]
MNFTNPYNFVSLTGACEKKKRPIPLSGGAGGNGLFTGELVCFLTPKTPLFIPNTSNEHMFPAKEKEILDQYNRTAPRNRQVADTPENRSKSYDFFSYSDLSPEKGGAPTEWPVIPGSSIRGVIRSVYETITHSCLSTSGGRETPLYRRSTVPRGCFGIIKDGKLYAADKYLVKPAGYKTGYSDCSRFAAAAFSGAFGEQVRVTVDRTKTFVTSRNIDTGLHPVTSVNQPGDAEVGYFLPGESFGGGNKKHFDAVMVEKTTQPGGMPYQLTERDRERLATVVELYSHGKNGVNQTSGHNEYSGFWQAEVVPVYYEVIAVDANGNKIAPKYYIAPAAVTKEAFDRSIRSMLRANGGFDACADVDKLCEACHLFGMVESGQGAEARSSRLQFRDAAPSEDGGYMGDVVSMPILGTPKITATEFYMEQSDDRDDIFNYDYAQQYDFKKKTMSSYVLADADARLRGRKFYWHHGTPPQSAAPTDAPKLFAVVRPVLAGKKFRFTVAFERLSLDELSKLCRALELDPAHAHKLGRGKPVGYGSVQISIARDESRVYSLDDDFQIAAQALPEGAFAYKIRNADFLALTNIALPKRNIRYPVGTVKRFDRRTNTVQSQTNVFNWFVLNREANGGNSTTRPKFAYVLPKANAPDVTLPAITKEPVPAQNRGGRPQDRGGSQITEGRGSNRAAVWDWYEQESKRR